MYGQVDSIEQKILNYSNSKSSIISKGRELLLDKFLENDIDKVKEIKNYLMEKGEDENYVAFYPFEYWFILYWTKEYEELSNNIIAFDSTKVASYNTRICPSRDFLITMLKSKSIENASALINQIELSDIAVEKKKVLRLNFESLIMKDESFQDTLNIQADNFLKTYPETEYRDFIKQYIKYTLVPKNWGYAVELFSGYGILTGELKDNFTNNIPIGFAGDICYKRFELYLRFYIGFNKTNADLAYSTGTYEKGSSVRMFLPEASFGYAALDKERFKLSPFAGIGGMYINLPSEKTKEIPALKEIELSAFTCNFGVNFDLKFGKRKYDFSPKTSYPFLRIRYTFCLVTDKNIKGNTHCITIGYGWFDRGLKRAY